MSQAPFGESSEAEEWTEAGFNKKRKDISVIIRRITSHGFSS